MQNVKNCDKVIRRLSSYTYLAHYGAGMDGKDTAAACIGYSFKLLGQKIRAFATFVNFYGPPNNTTSSDRR